jgi:hypothetical protein
MKVKGAFLGVELLFSPAEARCDTGPNRFVDRRSEICCARFFVLAYFIIKVMLSMYVFITQYDRTLLTGH